MAETGSYWTGHPGASTLPRIMVNELDALRTAKLLLDQHGAKVAWHILTSRAVQEHVAGQVDAREITQQVLAALHKLTTGPDGKPRH